MIHSALLIISFGLLLEDDTFRVAVGLCLGASLCKPRQCICVNVVNIRDNLSLHGLSCKRSAGRTLRYNCLNDLVNHDCKQNCHSPSNPLSYFALIVSYLMPKSTSINKLASQLSGMSQSPILSLTPINHLRRWPLLLQ